ncbi:MAG: hypothetical protein ACKOW9_05275 [Candidatus Paceibacterota bacterium]
MLKLSTYNFIGVVLAVAFLGFVPQMASAHPGFYMLESEDTQALNACTDTKANPAPVIYSMTPDTVSAGSDAMTVVVKGANLMPCSIAKWNGEDRPTTYVNPTRVLVEVRASDVLNPGQYLVTVVNPGPGGGFSNALVMTVKSTQVVATATTGSVQGASTTNKSTKVSTASTKPAIVAKASTTSGAVAGSTISNNTLDMSASAINANNSFMPDTLIEWLILVVLIFIGIKLFRKMGEENNAPKHA